MLDNPLFIAFYLISLLIGFSLHEAGHAFCADYLGDKTARHRGRLTLNPIKHLDPFGSLGLPLILIAIGSPFVFAAAKPVPVNPRNFRRPYMDFAITALAGPMVNIILALLGAFAFRFADLGSTAFDFLIIFVWANSVLAFFNLLPIPPLDGSKIIAGFMPPVLAQRILSLDRVGFLILMALIFGSSIIGFDVLRLWILTLLQAFSPLLDQASGLRFLTILSIFFESLKAG